MYFYIFFYLHIFLHIFSNNKFQLLNICTKRVHNYLRKILTSALGHRLQLKKVFMEKEKKAINVLTDFFISHKSDIKTFFNSIKPFFN